MAMNEIRQAARKNAVERVTQLRRERANLVKKRESLAATVMTAVAERDALIRDAERRAGTALVALVETGLIITEAVQWCDLTDRDGARLVKLAQTGAAEAS